MPGYFTQQIEHPTHSETLEAALVALEGELPPDVYADFSGRVRREISRLTSVLEKIARGYPCSEKEDMQCMAWNALPQKK